MRAPRVLLPGALGVMLGTLPARPAAAQVTQAPPLTAPRPVEGGRTALEAFYTRVGLNAGGRTTQAGGVGGRLMWAVDASGSGSAALARRAAVGVFGAYTPETQGMATGQFGIAADVAPFARPLAGRVEPFVSVGAGALHTNAQGALVARPSPRPFARGGVAAAEAPDTRTEFLLAPSAGARVRVRVRPGVLVQGDVRRLVTFGGGPRQHSAVGTGVRLTF